MANGNEICRMDAVTLAGKVRAKELSPVEVIEASIARMDKLEPLLHAFCTPGPDLARKAAKQLEADIMAGKDPGPLAGVPIGVKDLICTKDLPTVSGSFAYKDFNGGVDDVVVERLRAAGAIVTGKTNVPEFGYSGAGHNPVFETSRNPWDLERNPGGSSAGAGAAVAAGMGPFGIGSDGGGSVRIPASFSGLVGIKASMGRVPLWPGTKDETLPGVSSWESLECIGPLSRTVADSALMLSVISGPDMRDRRTLPKAEFDWMGCLNGDLKGLRVAYSADWGYVAVDPEVRQIVGDAVKLFESELGCTVEEADPGWDDPFGAFWGLVAAETDLVGMRKLVDEHGHHMTPHLVDFLRTPWTAEMLTDAVMARKGVANKAAAFMANYDLLLTPTLTVPPFAVHIQGVEKIDGQIVHPFQWLSFTLPFNMTGQPAASVPAGFTKSGLPVGLQIVGRHLDDPAVMRACANFEKARPWADKWPPLLAEMGL
ncbi:MAG: amidase family protein [Alphaproteobacteria bacterium]|jgi:aspartyl-tRNA(Asn)/glutamyl-tRNA(Gln) amidotransferase subunit A|nr:amidase family protein [Alphaproteobacteria bacterium]MDP6588747.1 amidase family protein [Alphaproteobacteria bacterium]